MKTVAPTTINIDLETLRRVMMRHGGPELWAALWTEIGLPEPSGWGGNTESTDPEGMLPAEPDE